MSYFVLVLLYLTMIDDASYPIKVYSSDVNHLVFLREIGEYFDSSSFRKKRCPVMD